MGRADALQSVALVPCPLWVKSGHFVKSGRCPLYPRERTSELNRVMSALCQKRTHALQQFYRYSITSSARVSSDGAILRSSAFAVLRLTTNWYLVGASTGRSDGFSPLRIRST